MEIDSESKATLARREEEGRQLAIVRQKDMELAERARELAEVKLEAEGRVGDTTGNKLHVHHRRRAALLVRSAAKLGGGDSFFRSSSIT